MTFPNSANWQTRYNLIVDIGKQAAKKAVTSIDIVRGSAGFGREEACFATIEAFYWLSTYLGAAGHALSEYFDNKEDRSNEACRDAATVSLMMIVIRIQGSGKVSFIDQIDGGLKMFEKVYGRKPVGCDGLYNFCNKVAKR